MAAPMFRKCMVNVLPNSTFINIILHQNCKKTVTIFRQLAMSSTSAIGPLHVTKCTYCSEAALEVSNKHKELSNIGMQPHSKHIIEFRKNLKVGPSLNHFIANSSDNGVHIMNPETGDKIPYLSSSDISGNGRKVYFEVYGCQMNVNDTDIAWSILKDNGFSKTNDILQADVILVMTCSIREGAEQKIWNYMKYLKGLKMRRSKLKDMPPLKIGILGCMAERLKSNILDEEKAVDLIAGPDSYKDLPAMLAVTNDGHAALNVMLSLDETYAHIMPVQHNVASKSAFVSIMRGCDNMCSYCIVPFTRGRERSRPIASIKEEIIKLSDQGVKEVVLLGQNVNSYRDLSEQQFTTASAPTRLASGFQTIYKDKVGGRRFSDLLQVVSQVDPEMRIRFTSPHPKDFPDELLYLIRDTHNICNQLHMPAQSGNTDVLKAMRRGYSREAYLDLIGKVKSILPDVALSSDFICGFCGETEEAHQDTVSLMRQVKYNNAFIFPYSLRDKTHAHRKLVDDVPLEVKKRRAAEVVQLFRDEAEVLNKAKIGDLQVILIEGKSKRSNEYLAGRNDAFIKVIVPDVEIEDVNKESQTSMKPGDYVIVKITAANSQVLKGIPLKITSLKQSAIELG